MPVLSLRALACSADIPHVQCMGSEQSLPKAPRERDAQLALWGTFEVEVAGAAFVNHEDSDEHDSMMKQENMHITHSPCHSSKQTDPFRITQTFDAP
eukprot:6173488-Pleurochrysis_carterae.AAC.8